MRHTTITRTSPSTRWKAPLPTSLRAFTCASTTRKKAVSLLEDLMEAGPLKAAPSLSFLGLAVMDELCACHMQSLVVH